MSNFIGRYVLRLAFNTYTVEQLLESSKAIALSDIMQIAEANLVILIVTRLSKMESKLADRVKKAGGTIVIK